MPVTFAIAGRPPPPPIDFFGDFSPDKQQAHYVQISPGLFRTMDVPLLKGRQFTAEDRQGSPGVAIISELVARWFFPNEEPLGKVLQVTFRNGSGTLQDMPREIVGVVADTRSEPRRSPAPHIYVPFRQHLGEYPGYFGPVMHLGKCLFIRTATDPTALAASVRRLVAEQGMNEQHYTTTEQLISEAAEFERLWVRVLGIFAGLAVFLAAVGLYGVISYSVTQRTHEFGLRMALGADRGNLLGHVLRQGLALSLIGVAIGVVAAVGLTRLIESYLYGVTPTDPATFAAVSVLLVPSLCYPATFPPAGRRRSTPWWRCGTNRPSHCPRRSAAGPG